MLHLVIALVTKKLRVCTRTKRRDARKDGCATSGLKARATLAWGEAPGCRSFARCGLKARAKCLVPYETLVKSDAVLREHGTHFCLKVTPAMMCGLVVDVLYQRRPVAQANGKGRITTLPTELCKFGTFGFDPFGGGDFQAFRNARYRLRSRQKQGDMDVVVNAADAHADVFGVAQNRCQISVQFGPDRVGQQGPAVFCAEDDVHQHIGERLRHGGEYNVERTVTARQTFSACLQPAIANAYLTWGVAPGYGSAGLQPAVLQHSSLTGCCHDEGLRPAAGFPFPKAG